MKNLPFWVFVKIWNQRMRQATPDIHIQMANWLEHSWINGDKRLLLMAFRSAGKSTIVGLFAAWLLYRNPDLRILVLAADLALAKKMVRNVKRIIEAHPLTGKLKPHKADQWGAERFTINRTLELRDPSMLAKGITANITGSRADVIICDDVEVPQTCDSADKREDLRARLAEMNYVQVAGGTQLYVGTPHSYYTIYADEPRVEIGEEQAFLSEFKRLKLPILTKDAQSAWEDRYSIQDIERLKRATGMNKFYSQMMLEPRNIAESRLNPDLIKIYDAPLDMRKELGALFIGQTKMISASAYWDPAFGSEKGDGSVLAIIFADKHGNFYLHHLAYLKAPEPLEAQEGVDAATHQCKVVAGIAKQHYLPSLTVEANGIGKFLPAILRNELVKAHAPCVVEELYQSRNKQLRILESLDTIMAAGRLYMHSSIRATSFLMEMREWRPALTNARDDALDAVAGAVALQPCWLPRLFRSGAQSWHYAKAAHKAKADYSV